VNRHRDTAPSIGRSTLPTQIEPEIPRRFQEQVDGLRAEVADDINLHLFRSTNALNMSQQNEAAIRNLQLRLTAAESRDAQHKLWMYGLFGRRVCFGAALLILFGVVLTLLALWPDQTGSIVTSNGTSPTTYLSPDGDGMETK
jgi:hypothetical protein